MSKLDIFDFSEVGKVGVDRTNDDGSITRVIDLTPAEARQAAIDLLVIAWKVDKFNTDLVKYFQEAEQRAAKETQDQGVESAPTDGLLPVSAEPGAVAGSRDGGGRC